MKLTQRTRMKFMMELSRRAHEYGVPKLATEIGVSKKGLYLALHPECGNPTLDTLLKMFDALNIRATVTKGRKL